MHPSSSRSLCGSWRSAYPLGSAGLGSRPHRVHMTPRVAEKRRETMKGGNPYSIRPIAVTGRRYKDATKHPGTSTRQ